MMPFFKSTHHFILSLLFFVIYRSFIQHLEMLMAH